MHRFEKTEQRVCPMAFGRPDTGVINEEVVSQFVAVVLKGLQLVMQVLRTIPPLLKPFSERPRRPREGSFYRLPGFVESRILVGPRKIEKDEQLLQGQFPELDGVHCPPISREQLVSILLLEGFAYVVEREVYGLRGYSAFASHGLIECIDKISPPQETRLNSFEDRDPLRAVHRASVSFEHVREQELVCQVLAPRQKVLDLSQYLSRRVPRLDERLRQRSVRLLELSLHPVPRWLKWNIFGELRQD